MFDARADAERRSEMESAADAIFALGPDSATHHFNKTFGDGEAKTGATVFARRGSISLGKCLEQAGALLGRHADAAVADGELQFDPVSILLLESNADDDLAAFGELDRVVDQIDQNLAEP